MALLLIVGGPFILVGLGIGWPWMLYYNHVKYQSSWSGKFCLTKCFIFLLFMCIGIVLFPVTVAIAVILAIVPGSCYLIGYIISGIRDCCRQRCGCRCRCRRRRQFHPDLLLIDDLGDDIDEINARLEAMMD